LKAEGVEFDWFYVISQLCHATNGAYNFNDLIETPMSLIFEQIKNLNALSKISDRKAKAEAKKTRKS
jgi:hypothetical protein